MRRVYGYACAALRALVLSAPAGAAAQDDGPVPPRGAAIAAGPLPGGATLLAFDRGGELCDGLRHRRSSCGRAPSSPAHPRVDFAEGVVYGATTADVAAVQVQERGRTQTGGRPWRMVALQTTRVAPATSSRPAACPRPCRSPAWRGRRCGGWTPCSATARGGVSPCARFRRRSATAPGRSPSCWAPASRCARWSFGARAVPPP